MTRQPVIRTEPQERESEFKWSVAWCHEQDQAAANTALQTAGLGPRNFGVQTTQDPYDPNEIDEDGQFTGTVTGYSMWGQFEAAERQAAKAELQNAGFTLTTRVDQKQPGSIPFEDYGTSRRKEVLPEDRVDGFLGSLAERRTGQQLEGYFVVRITESHKTYNGILGVDKRLTDWDELTLVGMEKQGARAKVLYAGTYRIGPKTIYIWDDRAGHNYTFGIEINGRVEIQFTRSQSPFTAPSAGFDFPLALDDLVAFTARSDDTDQLVMQIGTELRLERISA